MCMNYFLDVIFTDTTYLAYFHLSQLECWLVISPFCHYILHMYMTVPISTFELVDIMPLETVTTSIFNVVCSAVTVWKLYGIVRQK